MSYNYQAQYYPPMTGGDYVGDQVTIIGGTEELKAFFEKETMGVKNKYLALGALALGVGYYGYTKGWF
jgi:hypothetical protein